MKQKKKLTPELRLKAIKNLNFDIIRGKTREEVYGKKKAKEWSKKVSDSLKDKKRKPLSQNHKQQISDTLKGRIPKNISLINKNKFGKNNPMYNMTGEKNPAWRGGISFEPYDKKFNLRFKKFIKDRDGRCMLCNISFEDLKLIKKKIAVHHINYNKLLTIKENCVCLCNSCHSKTNANRKHWIKFFQSLLSEEYDYKYGNKNEILLNFSPIIKT